MSGISRAEEVLLEQIRSGDQQAWSQLVVRYRGRLLSFARTKLGRREDAEDIIQDTFIGFLTGLGSFRADAGIETYLFTILRRKIINSYRSAHAKHICLLQDVYRSTERTIGDSDAFSALASDEMTASFYARKEEQNEQLRSTLSEALTILVDNYKSALNFRDMQIIELLFYCQLSNQDVAKIVGVNERNIAVIKHRCLKQVRDHAASARIVVSDETQLEDLLTQVWEAGRLSCPKRSTIGAFLLGTLDGDWRDYVDFHLNKLGCHFCRANLADLQEQTADDESKHLQKRIMESTVGFLHKPR
ncbi:MAG: sigma-70 family RNA polymerase sigma factor [Sedimentisphaerales bacterium]|nr:sigma-70 family RNA polymerase sigma factor [Sedimentisphaerales bacterium]